MRTLRGMEIRLATPEEQRASLRIMEGLVLPPAYIIEHRDKMLAFFRGRQFREANRLRTELERLVDQETHQELVAESMRLHRLWLDEVVAQDRKRQQFRKEPECSGR